MKGTMMRLTKFLAPLLISLPLFGAAQLSVDDSANMPATGNIWNNATNQVIAAYTFANSGDADDSIVSFMFDLGSSHTLPDSLVTSIDFYVDADTDGVIDAGEAHYTTSSTSFGSDGSEATITLDSGIPVAQGTSVDVLVAVTLNGSSTEEHKIKFNTFKTDLRPIGASDDTVQIESGTSTGTYTIKVATPSTVVEAGSGDPTANTDVLNVDENVVIKHLTFNNTGEGDDLISAICFNLSSTSNTISDSTIASVDFYADTDGDGVIDAGESQITDDSDSLSGSGTASFNFTGGLAVPAGGSASMIMAVSFNGTSTSEEKIKTISFDSSCEPTGKDNVSGTTSGASKIFYVKVAESSVTVEAGDNDPASSFEVSSGDSDVVVKVWKFTNSGNRDDIITAINVKTASGHSITDTDIASVDFYLDNNSDGVIDASDTKVSDNTDSFEGASSTKSFTFDSGFTVPTGGSVNLIMAVSLSGSNTEDVKIDTSNFDDADASTRPTATYDDKVSGETGTGSVAVTIKAGSSSTSSSSSSSESSSSTTSSSSSESSSSSSSSSSSEAGITKIHEIQTDGSAATEDVEYTIKAVVTAKFDGLDGYFIQEEDSDADSDPKTSEGLYVYDTTNSPSVGDLIKITGKSDEYYDMTQLSSISSFENLGASTLPTAATLTLPVSSMDEWEYVEGMLVNVVSDDTTATDTGGNPVLTVTEVYSLGRYGEFVLSSGGRLRQFTDTNDPDVTGYANHLTAIEKRKALIDDGASTSNPDPSTFLVCNTLSADNTLRAGYTFDKITGVVHYSYSTFRIQPTECITVDQENQTNARTATPEDVGGTLKVASVNVLNYFTTLDDGTKTIQGEDPRGANDLEEFTRQKDKTISAMEKINADIFGIMEIENNGFQSDSALEDLVNGLNTKMGTSKFTYIGKGGTGITGNAVGTESGKVVIGTDVIKTAIIYNSETVEPVGNAHGVNLGNTEKNRPATIQTFKQKSTGETLTVAVNHFKSKGSDCDSLGDPNTNDGQGNCAKTRTEASEDLMAYFQANNVDSNNRYLVIGDLNSYAKEDPVMAFINNGYSDIYTQFLGHHGYSSYGFAGEWGYLDHALVSTALKDAITGVTDWHINADEPSVLSYNTDYLSDGQKVSFYSDGPYRASDHDPVVIGLDLRKAKSIDTQAPTVASTNPSDGATSVSLNQSITITMSEEVKSSGLSLNVTNGASGVSGDVSVNDNQIVFAPSSNMVGGATYTIKLSTVQDTSGNALTGEYSFSFTTSSSNVDNTRPTVTSMEPLNGSTGVDTGSNIIITFSEELDSSTVTPDTITLRDANDQHVGADIRYGNKSVIYDPSSSLEAQAAYTIKITTGVKDTAGNAMSRTYTFSFTTGSASGTQIVNTEEQEYVEKSLVLGKKWNLVSIPVDESQFAAMFGDYRDIWYYAKKGWIANPNLIKPGQGFWIYMDKSHIASFKGLAYDLDSSALESGWNLVGLGNDADQAKIAEWGVKKIWVYEDGWESDPGTLLSGQGVWLKK